RKGIGLCGEVKKFLVPGAWFLVVYSNLKTSVSHEEVCSNGKRNPLGTRSQELFLHGEEHSICPPKTILIRVLSPAGLCIVVQNIVLLCHLPRFLVHLQVGIGPVQFDLLCQIIHSIIRQSLVSHPLKRRPAVGGIPLLTGAFRGGRQSAWF